MIIYQIIGLLILLLFYGVYIGKMYSQHRRGIKIHYLGSKKKSQRAHNIEQVLKIVTFLLIFVELISIYFASNSFLNTGWIVAGLVISAIGTGLFIFSMYSMHDSWRIGVSKNEKVTFVQNGIYSISRNPAFLGFYLQYIGLLLAFFNMVHLVFVLWAIIMLHLQIRQEEIFLEKSLGDEYIEYKRKVKRYFLFC